MTNTDIIRTVQTGGPNGPLTQGKLVARHPFTNEATIRFKGKLLSGVLVGSYRNGRKAA